MRALAHTSGGVAARARPKRSAPQSGAIDVSVNERSVSNWNTTSYWSPSGDSMTIAWRDTLGHPFCHVNKCRYECARDGTAARVRVINSPRVRGGFGSSAPNVSTGITVLEPFALTAIDDPGDERLRAHFARAHRAHHARLRDRDSGGHGGWHERCDAGSPPPVLRLHSGRTSSQERNLGARRRADRTSCSGIARRRARSRS
jgi:hypothetical protein